MFSHSGNFSVKCFKFIGLFCIFVLLLLSNAAEYLQDHFSLLLYIIFNRLLIYMFLDYVCLVLLNIALVRLSKSIN